MLKRLFGDSFIYGVTSYLSVIAGIILTPFYTRIFTKPEYGIMDIFNVWNAFAIAIVPLGLITSIITFFPDVKGNAEKRRALLGTILTSITGLSLVYLTGMLLFEKFFFRYLDFPKTKEMYYHSIFIVISSLFIAYFKVILQAKFLKYKYAFLSIVNFVVLSGLGFVFVYFFDMRVVGFFRASSISMALTLILALVLSRTEFYFSFDKLVLKKVLIYSTHLLSVFFLFQIINLIDRYILLHYGTLEGVGVYNIGSKISSIIKIIYGAFATAWFPIAMSIKDDKNAKETYKLIHNVFFTVTLFLLGSLFLFRKELILFFAPTYQESYNIIGILALSYAVNASIYIYSVGLHIKKKTKYLTVSAIWSIVGNIILSIILMQWIGIDGVAWGTLLGGVIWIILQLYYSQKVFFIKFDFLYVFIILIGLFGTMFLTHYIDENKDLSFNTIIIIKIILIVFFTTLLWPYLKRKYQDYENNSKT